MYTFEKAKIKQMLGNDVYDMLKETKCVLAGGARSVGESIIRQQWETFQKNMESIMEEKKIFNIRVKIFDNYGTYEYGYI